MKRILLTFIAALIMFCAAGAAEPERQGWSTASAYDRMREINLSIKLKRYEKVATALEEIQYESARLKSEGADEKVIREKFEKQQSFLRDQAEILQLTVKTMAEDEAARAKAEAKARAEAEAKAKAEAEAKDKAEAEAIAAVAAAKDRAKAAEAKAKADAERKAGK